MANTAWIPALLVGAVAGVAGGMVAGTLVSEPPTVGPVEVRQAGPAAGAVGKEVQQPDPAAGYGEPIPDMGPLADRVAGLERELALLRSEVAGRRRLDQPPPAVNLDPGALEPILDEAMGAFLDERQAQEEAERRAREEQRRQERLSRQMERWQEQLGLSDAQAADMQTILTEAETKRNAFFEEARESGNFDREAMRSSMTRFQEELNVALGGILTTDQFAAYQESTAGNPFGAMGGFGGRGGDRFGGGGGRPGGGGRGGF